MPAVTHRNHRNQQIKDAYNEIDENISGYLPKTSFDVDGFFQHYRIRYPVSNAIKTLVKKAQEMLTKMTDSKILGRLENSDVCDFKECIFVACTSMNKFIHTFAYNKYKSMEELEEMKSTIEIEYFRYVFTIYNVVEKIMRRVNTTYYDMSMQMLIYITCEYIEHWQNRISEIIEGFHYGINELACVKIDTTHEEKNSVSSLKVKLASLNQQLPRVSFFQVLNKNQIEFKNDEKNTYDEREDYYEGCIHTPVCSNCVFNGYLIKSDRNITRIAYDVKNAGCYHLDLFGAKDKTVVVDFIYPIEGKMQLTIQVDETPHVILNLCPKDEGDYDMNIVRVDNEIPYCEIRCPECKQDGYDYVQITDEDSKEFLIMP